MTTTRQLAVLILNKILNKGIKIKEAMSEVSSALDKQDRSFLMEIVFGVLRYRNYLDWMLKDFLRRPSGLSPYTINNFRVALYQILFMRVPEWAVVNEAVNIEKIEKKRLVNAVLRNFIRNKEKIKLPQEKTVNYIAIKTSHPKWLIKRWIDRFGFEEALLLAEANNKIPPIILRADNSEKREEIIKDFSERGIEAYPTKYSPAGIVLNEFFISLEEDIRKYNLYVQDEASQLVTYLLNPLSDEKILDACAAPGGKTTHIANLMGDKGEIIALESEEKRIRLLRENIERFNYKSIKILFSDIRNVKNLGPFDKILVDAPCSAIGVIRRNPDVKYKHKKNDLRRYKATQLDILYASSLFLKAGGSMVYSVCSTELEEGEEVVETFLKKNPNFYTIEGDYDFLEPFKYVYKGMIIYRTFLHKHNMDGFFMARLKKLEK
jgi:16S rRNA (cytosine967-C5)-methyltransferase